MSEPTPPPQQENELALITRWRAWSWKRQHLAEVASGDDPKVAARLKFIKWLYEHGRLQS